jgi:hypothetical protein
MIDAKDSHSAPQYRAIRVDGNDRLGRHPIVTGKRIRSREEVPSSNEAARRVQTVWLTATASMADLR